MKNLCDQMDTFMRSSKFPVYDDVSGIIVVGVRYRTAVNMLACRVINEPLVWPRS